MFCFQSLEIDESIIKQNEHSGIHNLALLGIQKTLKTIKACDIVSYQVCFCCDDFYVIK